MHKHVIMNAAVAVIAASSANAGIYDAEGKFGGVYSCTTVAATGLKKVPWEGNWKPVALEAGEQFVFTVAREGEGTEKWFDRYEPAYQYTASVTEKGKSPSKCTTGFRTDENGKTKLTVPIREDGTLWCGDGFQDFRVELKGLAFQIEGTQGDQITITDPVLPTTRYIKAGNCERL